MLSGYDEDGIVSEENRRVILSAWFNERIIYEPVVAIEK